MRRKSGASRASSLIRVLPLRLGEVADGASEPLGERCVAGQCFRIDADPPFAHGATGAHFRARGMRLFEQPRVLGRVDSYEQAPVLVDGNGHGVVDHDGHSSEHAHFTGVLGWQRGSYAVKHLARCLAGGGRLHTGCWAGGM